MGGKGAAQGMPQQPGYNMIGKQMPGMGGKGSPQQMPGQQMPQQPGYNMIGKQLPGMIGGKGSPQMPGQQMPPGVMGDYMKQLKGQQMPQMPGQQMTVPSYMQDYYMKQLQGIMPQQNQPMQNQSQQNLQLQLMKQQLQGMQPGQQMPGQQIPFSPGQTGFLGDIQTVPSQYQDFEAARRAYAISQQPMSLANEGYRSIPAPQQTPNMGGLASLGAIDPRMLA
jgi:hypothetical protein